MSKPPEVNRDTQGEHTWQPSILKPMYRSTAWPSRLMISQPACSASGLGSTRRSSQTCAIKRMSGLRPSGSCRPHFSSIPRTKSAVASCSCAGQWKPSDSRASPHSHVFGVGGSNPAAAGESRSLLHCCTDIGVAFHICDSKGNASGCLLALLMRSGKLPGTAATQHTASQSCCGASAVIQARAQPSPASGETGDIWRGAQRRP